MTGFAGVFRVLTALGIMLALSLDPAEASSGGKISGVVKDAASGKELPHANIVVVDTELETEADEKGRFFILNLRAGTYTLKATHIGYAHYTVEEVRVSAGLSTRIAVELTSSDIQVEEVIIRAERPIIDKNATNAVRIVEAEDLEILPFRGVGQVFNLQPGVVLDEGALHIRGSRSDEIAYYVDGASVRNPVTGGMAVHLIDEALQEIQLQAGGFNAEYGGANAGIILQGLRTGSPDWQVGVLSETDNFTSAYKKRFGTYSYGYSTQVLTLSGPLDGKSEDSYHGISGSLTRQTDTHQYKLGFDVQRWTSRRFGIASSPIRNAIENNYPELDAVYDRHYAGEIAEDKVMDALIAKAETLPDSEGSLDDFAALIRNTSRADFFGFDAFGRQFTAVASFDITGFYRDVEGQLQLQRQDVSANAQNANAYNFLQNGDFATTKGLEFVFKLRRVKRLRTEFNYTLSDARGTGSSRPAAVRPTGSYTKPSTWPTGSTTGSPKAAIFSAVRARFAWGSNWTSSG